MIKLNHLKSFRNVASIFKSNLSDDASNCKIIFEDRGKFIKIPYHVTISAFLRGIVVYLRISDYQQILEITQNVKIPIEVPTPIGMAGILLGVDDLNVKDETMELNFTLDASIGFLGTHNLVKKCVRYVKELNINQISKSVNEVVINQLLILIGLIKVDTQVRDEEKILFCKFMDDVGVPLDEQEYLLSILTSDRKFVVNYSLLKNSVNASVIIDVLVDIAKSDDDVSVSELEYIFQTCDHLGVDAQFAINELNGNYCAVKYYLKDQSTETQGILVYPFNNGNEQAQFYTNNRIFIFDKSKKILAKGTYLNGGKKMVLDDGSVFEANTVLENLGKFRDLII